MDYLLEHAGDIIKYSLYFEGAYLVSVVYRDVTSLFDQGSADTRKYVLIYISIILSLSLSLARSRSLSLSLSVLWMAQQGRFVLVL